MRHFYRAAIASVMLLAACDSKVYDTYRHTPLAGWEKNDTLFYDIPPMTESGEYELSIGIRTGNAFPFMAVTMIVDQTIVPGNKKMTDTIDCRLMEEGSTSRNGGISYFQYSRIIRRMRLAVKDSLHISVRHDMKREILPGVSDIGITLARR